MAYQASIRPVRRRLAGFTLVEMLIAMAILMVILGITYAAIMQGLQVQSSQEAATSTQARLRRVTEVFTQELRSAVLGAISDVPYASGANAVSFTLLDGGAGYQVSNIDAVGNLLTVVIGSEGSNLGSGGEQLMLVDAGGQAVIFRLNGAPTSAGGGGFRVYPQGSSCFDGLALKTEGSTQNALLFRVKTIGMRFDEGSQTLFQTEGVSSERALAFDLTGVDIEYVYRETNTDALHIFAEPLRADGRPTRNTAYASQPVELVRLQVGLSSSAHSLLGTVSRNYVGQVELAANPSFQIKAVSSCS